MTKQPFQSGKKRLKRKKGGGTNKPYFGREVHDAIVAHILSDDEIYKVQLFNNIIRPAFDKLVENIIHIYGYMKTSDSFEQLKSDTVSHLYEKMPKFDHTKDYKAFSYFNIVARNHLTLDSRKKQKISSSTTDIDNKESMSTDEQESLERHTTLEAPDESAIKEEYLDSVIELLEYIGGKLKKENEKKTLHAIIFTFKNLDNVDLLNKRAVFEYLRNITGLNSKQLTTTIASIKKYYKILRGDKTYGIFF